VAFAEDHPLGSASATDPDSPSEFTPGRTAGLLQGFVKLGVSICHEIVYPELVHRSVRDGAELLVNVSNDGWLDGRSGVASRQHFAMSVFRAVEARRYLIRGAITGVSGIVDPIGRVVSSLGSNESGVLAAEVAGRRELTPYVRFGDAFAVACAIVSLAALAHRRLRLRVWSTRRVRPVPAI
jgi:apolipoprotein N-acyltransferase